MAPKRVLRHVLDLSDVEIKFFMLFSFSLVSRFWSKATFHFCEKTQIPHNFLRRRRGLLLPFFCAVFRLIDRP